MIATAMSMALCTSLLCTVFKVQRLPHLTLDAGPIHMAAATTLEAVNDQMAVMISLTTVSLHYVL